MIAAYRGAARRARPLLAVVDRAYSDRIAEHVAYRADRHDRLYPELAAYADVENYRRQVERDLRTFEGSEQMTPRELLDLWRFQDLPSGVGDDAT